MDTSEQYIKMCEGAEELQIRCQSYPGDIWYHEKWGIGIANYHYPYLPSDKGVEKVFWFDGYGSKTTLECGRAVIVGGNFVWLPRQDQLQEIVKIDSEYWCNLAWRFSQWLSKRPFENPSIEQLWLAFVMKEKYGKIWDGNQWTN